MPLRNFILFTKDLLTVLFAIDDLFSPNCDCCPSPCVEHMLTSYEIGGANSTILIFSPICTVLDHLTLEAYNTCQITYQE